MKTSLSDIYRVKLSAEYADLRKLLDGAESGEKALLNSLKGSKK